MLERSLGCEPSSQRGSIKEKPKAYVGKKREKENILKISVALLKHSSAIYFSNPESRCIVAELNKTKQHFLNHANFFPFLFTDRFHMIKVLLSLFVSLVL